jgi:hypothetical protein
MKRQNSKEYLIVAEIQHLQWVSQSETADPVPSGIIRWGFTKFIVWKVQTI